MGYEVYDVGDVNFSIVAAIELGISILDLVIDTSDTIAAVYDDIKTEVKSLVTWATNSSLWVAGNMLLSDD